MRTLLIALCLFGCSEGKRVTITQTVGSNGGTVEAGDGTAVNIPAGALAAQANITIESVNVTPPNGVVQVGPAYDFGPEGSNFANPVTITLVFAPDRIPSGKSTADVRIYTAPRGSSNFTTVTPIIDAGVLAKTTTTHFTTYFPGVPTSAVAVDMKAGGDMASTCVPFSCVSSTTMCDCVGGPCGSASMIQLKCSQETTNGPAFCFCLVNGQTLSTPMPTLDSCSEAQAAAAFPQCAP